MSGPTLWWSKRTATTLSRLLDDQPAITATVPGATGGGWVGYLGYGLGRLVERLPAPPLRPVPLPGSILAFYDHVISRDSSGRWWFEALWSDEQSERLEPRLSEWRRRARAGAPDAGEFALGAFALSPGPESHLVVGLAGDRAHPLRATCSRSMSARASRPGSQAIRSSSSVLGAERLEPRYGAFLAHPLGCGRELLARAVLATSRAAGS